MRIFLVLAALCMLIGCMEQNTVGTVASRDIVYNRVCIDGVEYLQHQAGNAGFMAPHFKPDGSLYTCVGNY